MPIPNMTTNLPNGITNVVDATASTLGSLPFPDPSRCHTWWDDFDDYTAAQWTITETGSGTRAVGDIDGGVLVITNAAADNDRNFLQWSGNTNGATVETWLWEAGKSMWMKARLKISDATESDLAIGLYVTDTDPLAITDGLWFSKADGSTSLIFNATASSTAQTVTAATLASNTFFTCGFWWDANLGTLTVYYNDNPVGVLTSTTTFPTTELAHSFGIQNGEGVAKVLSLDYLLVSKDRQQPAFA